MLRGLDPLLHADLLHVLASMGHGDELALVDATSPPPPSRAGWSASTASAPRGRWRPSSPSSRSTTSSRRRPT
jgi:hypothetical protein